MFDKDFFVIGAILLAFGFVSFGWGYGLGCRKIEKQYILCLEDGIDKSICKKYIKRGK